MNQVRSSRAETNKFRNNLTLLLEVKQINYQHGNIEILFIKCIFKFILNKKLNKLIKVVSFIVYV